MATPAVLLNREVEELLREFPWLTDKTLTSRKMTSKIQKLNVESPDVILAVRVAGNLKSGNVLIALHGGPGMCSDYLLDLGQLAGPELAVDL